MRTKVGGVNERNLEKHSRQMAPVSTICDEPSCGLLVPFREIRQRYLSSLHFGGAEDRLSGQKRRSLKTSLKNCRICELLVPKIDDFIS